MVRDYRDRHSKKSGVSQGSMWAWSMIFWFLKFFHARLVNWSTICIVVFTLDYPLVQLSCIVYSHSIIIGQLICNVYSRLVMIGQTCMFMIGYQYVLYGSDTCLIPDVEGIIFQFQRRHTYRKHHRLRRWRCRLSHFGKGVSNHFIHYRIKTADSSNHPRYHNLFWKCSFDPC